MAVFDEIFSLLDASDNRVEIGPELIGCIAHSCISVRNKVATVLVWMTEKEWLKVVTEVVTESEPCSYYEAPNYWKYHRKREEKGANLATQEGDSLVPKRNQLGALPSLPYPNLEKKDIYILITGFSLSQDLKAKAKAEGLPNPDANLPAFIEFHKDSGTRLPQSWEYLFLNQLRYLAKPEHTHLRADQPTATNAHCTFSPKTREQLEEFGESPCLESILSPSKLYCPRHYEYYQAIIAKKTNNLLKNEQEGVKDDF